VKRGNRRAHFINGAGFDDEHRQLAALAHDETSMKVLEVIAQNPGIIKKDVGTALGMTRTGGIWHINKLLRLSVVEETRSHGHCALSVVPDKYGRLRDAIAKGEMVEPPEGAEAVAADRPAA